MRTYRTTLVAFGVLLGGVASVASAGTINLGGGWQASWDASWDPYLALYVDLLTPNAVYIQKFAQFTQPPGPGGFSAIPILFEQIEWPAVPQIVINDEIIINQTGVDWTDFHWFLMGDDAVFYEGPDFFFGTSPLDHQVFPDVHSFSVDGFGLGPGGTDAVVPNNSSWFPGDGVTDGELIMNATPHTEAPFAAFVLKEVPTPEPASALLLLAMAGLALRRGR